MKIILLPIALFLLSFSPPVSTNNFAIEFIQNGKTIPLQNKTVKLEPKAFTIKLTYTGNCVLLYGNSLPVYYDLQDTEHIPDLDKIGTKVMAEYNHNAEKEITIDGKGVSCWSYHPKYDVSGFDKTEVNGDTITGYRDIEYLFFPEEDKKVSVTTYKKPVYLVFFTSACKSGACAETQREQIKIDWKTGK